MRLYEGAVADFNAAVLENRIADQVAAKYHQHYKRAVGQPEFRAWQQSLVFVKNAFEYSQLRDNFLIIEYELPYSTRRIDVLIFGRDHHNIGDNPVRFRPIPSYRGCDCCNPTLER